MASLLKEKKTVEPWNEGFVNKVYVELGPASIVAFISSFYTL